MFHSLTEELQQISEIKEGPLSLTVDQRLQKYEKEIDMCNQIREQHQQQKKDLYQNFDQVWEAVQRMKGIKRRWYSFRLFYFIYTS